MPTLLELREDMTVVGLQFIDGEIAIALEVAVGTLQLQLGVQLGGLHGAVHILTDIEGRPIAMGTPPVHQSGIVGPVVADLPIELGHTIVDPAFLHP